MYLAARVGAETSSLLHWVEIDGWMGIWAGSDAAVCVRQLRKMVCSFFCGLIVFWLACFGRLSHVVQADKKSPAPHVELVEVRFFASFKIVCVVFKPR
jgi:hypothetical protein